MTREELRTEIARRAPWYQSIDFPEYTTKYYLPEQPAASQTQMAVDPGIPPAARRA